jgi:tetratricopeptide (TPR) repeat protein
MMAQKFFFSSAAALLAGSITCLGCGGAKNSDTANQSSAPEVVSEADQYMAQAGNSESEGDLKGAMANYLAAADAFDKTGDVTVARADAHSEAGRLAYQNAELQIAVDEYQKSVDIYLRFSGNARVKGANALNNMGAIYKEMQNKSRALNCWHQAIDLYKKAPPELQDQANIQKIEQNIRDLESGY